MFFNPVIPLKPSCPVRLACAGKCCRPISYLKGLELTNILPSCGLHWLHRGSRVRVPVISGSSEVLSWQSRFKRESKTPHVCGRRLDEEEGIDIISHHLLLKVYSVQCENESGMRKGVRHKCDLVTKLSSAVVQVDLMSLWWGGTELCVPASDAGPRSVLEETLGRPKMESSMLGNLWTMWPREKIWGKFQTGGKRLGWRKTVRTINKSWSGSSNWIIMLEQCWYSVPRMLFLGESFLEYFLGSVSSWQKNMGVHCVAVVTFL